MLFLGGKVRGIQIRDREMCALGRPEQALQYLRDWLYGNRALRPAYRLFGVTTASPWQRTEVIRDYDELLERLRRTVVDRSRDEIQDEIAGCMKHFQVGFVDLALS